VGREVTLQLARQTESAVLTAPDAPPVLGRRPALLVQLKAGDHQRVGPLEFEIWSDGAEQPRRSKIFGVRPGASLALDLGPETGSRVLSVALRADRWELEVESAVLSCGS
jgi:hypothetical protein